MSEYTFAWQDPPDVGAGTPVLLNPAGDQDHVGRGHPSPLQLNLRNARSQPGRWARVALFPSGRSAQNKALQIRKEGWTAKVRQLDEAQFGLYVRWEPEERTVDG